MLPLLIGAGAFFGSVLSGIGTIQQANAAAKAATANADQADEDSKTAAENANLTIQQSIDDERVVRVMGRRVIGSQKAAFGASGFQTDGSALDVLAESAANMERDAFNTRDQGRLKAAQFTEEAQRKKNYANALRNGASDAITGGMLSAGGQLITGATSFASKLNYSSSGLSRSN